MIKIFTDISHYDSTHRNLLNDILRPFIPKQKLKDCGIDSVTINLVHNIEDCDFCLLPMAWNYYLLKNKVYLAKQMIMKSKDYDKKIIIGVYGDYYFELSKYKNVIGMYASFYKSLNNLNDIPLPVIINDPLEYLNKSEIELREFTKIPSIGFCGQIDSSFIISIFKYINLFFKKLFFYSGISYKYYGPSVPPTLFRRRVIDVLMKSNKLSSVFICREKYQGGISKQDPSFDTIKTEFYQNINDTDYTICIRGTGNFSARFYETLAMGKIPIFINSDCVLPFSDVIDWKKHLIWIEQNEIFEIEDKILKFHNSLSVKKFQKIQKENRKLWEKYFQFSGFYNELSILLNRASKA